MNWNGSDKALAHKLVSTVITCELLVKRHLARYLQQLLE